MILLAEVICDIVACTHPTAPVVQTRYLWLRSQIASFHFDACSNHAYWVKAIYKCIYECSSHSQQHHFFHFSEGITKTISNKVVPTPTGLRKKNQDHICVSIEISTVGDIFISLRSIVCFFFSSVLEISLMRYICTTSWVEHFKSLSFLSNFSS